MKLIITELTNTPLVLADSKGNTFRLNASESKEVDKKLLSKDFEIAEERGYISITQIDIKSKDLIIKPRYKKGGVK